GSRTGPTGWAEFALTADPEVAPASSASSFDLTAAFAPPDGESVADSPDHVATRIFPDVSTEPEEPAPTIGPTPEPTPESSGATPEPMPESSGGWVYLGRNIAVAMLAAI